MATDLGSVDVVAGDDILASEYNTLRDDVVRRAGDYEVATGSSNAFVLAVDSSIASAYIEGTVFRFQANHDITGAATLNVNSIGAQTIKRPDGSDLRTGDIRNGDMCTVIDDGTNFILLTPVRPNQYVQSMTVDLTMIIDSQNDGVSVNVLGYSDDPSARIITLAAEGEDGEMDVRGWKDVQGPGIAIQPRYRNLVSLPISSSVDGVIHIGADYWYSNDDDNDIHKNGSTVTISGTARFGSLGHDVTNAYLLVLYDSTTVAKFSGIAGTTITNQNADVTLDNAVDTDIGWIYDDTNEEYIFVDTGSSALRKFDSSGTTLETVTLLAEEGNTDTARYVGLCFINDRVWVILGGVIDNNETEGTPVSFTFMPTNMLRS